MRSAYRFPFGAQITERGTTFRLWAPSCSRVELVIDRPVPHEMRPADVVPAELEMARGVDDFAELADVPVGAGTRYRYRIDGERSVPDPASRVQHDDVHGPSVVVDPADYIWHDADWVGRPWKEAVLYELHIGTFTQSGSHAAAIEKLPHLAALGVTAIELMPLSDFPGPRNWGYDGVLPYAPDVSYGTPNDLKRLIDACHSHGMMVFLDVVYNHFGPDGNFLTVYAKPFFTEEHKTPWGAAIDFTQPAVREFFVHNAVYWLEEYRFDGLRLDAVHAIHDPSERHILTELAERVRAHFSGRRHIHLVLENDANGASFLAPGRLYDAQWNDDFHHVAHLLATGEDAGYYGDYASDPLGKMARSLSEGFVYQGEPSPFRGNAPRGEPSGQLPPTAFVDFLQNHDQIGNRAFGERITALADRETVELLIAVQCLSPHIPMLFMGEEWGSKQPFYYSCSFHDALAAAVREGRRSEFSAFPEFSSPEARERIPDPNAESTRTASRLDWLSAESVSGQERLSLYRRLLEVRAANLRQGTTPRGWKRLAPQAFCCRYALEHGGSWLLCVNTGDDDVSLPKAAGAELAAVVPGSRDVAPGMQHIPAMTVVAARGEE